MVQPAGLRLLICSDGRLRRTAALAAAALLIWYASYFINAPNWFYIEPAEVMLRAFLVPEIAALVVSPGPRRGMQILTWKYHALVVTAAAAVGSTGWLPASAPGPVREVIVIMVVAVTVAGSAMASPLGRRIMVLLSIPIYYLVVSVVVPPLMAIGPGVVTTTWTGPLRITLTCLPLATRAWLSRPRSAPVTVPLRPAAGPHRAHDRQHPRPPGGIAVGGGVRTQLRWQQRRS